MLFILPRQIVELGDPMRRACDACESLGARFKKLIKTLTCRRTVRAQTQGPSTREHKNAAWRQAYTKGYVEQAFTRVTVGEQIRHGEENEAYLLREDWRLREQGLRGIKKERKDERRASIFTLMECEECSS